MKKHATQEAFYQRLKELAEVNKPVLKDNTRNLGTLIDYKRAADGIAYGIIKEQHHYYIKKAGIKQDPSVADFAYIGGLSNITEFQYSKLSEADKQRNMIFGTINEAVSHKPSLTGSKKKKLNEDKAGKEIDNAESKLGDLDAATSAETTPETPGAPLEVGAEPSIPDAVSSEPAADVEEPVAGAEEPAPADNAEPIPAGGEETDVTTGDETPAGDEKLPPEGEETGVAPEGEETPAGDEEVTKLIGKLTNKVRKTEMEDPEIKGELKSLISAYKDKLKKMDIEDRKEIADGILKVVGAEEIEDLGNSVEQNNPEGVNPETGIEEDQCAECGGFGKYAESRGYDSPEKFMECNAEEQANVVNGYVGAQEDGMNDGDEKTISLVIKLSPEVLDKLKTDYGRDDYAEKMQPQIDTMNESEEDTMAQLNELWGGLGALGKAAGQGIGKTASAVGGAIGGAAKNVAAGAQKAYNTAATGVKNVASNIKKTYNQGEINPEVSKLEGAAADLGKQIAALNKRMVGAGQQPLNVKSILATIQNQLGAGGQANLGKLRTAEGVVDPANIEVQPNVLKEEDETDEPETDSPEVATPETGEETPKETGIDAGEEAGIEANIEDAGEEPDKDADDVSFFGKDSQSLGGGVVKPDGAPTTAVDVTIEPDKTIQITMNEAKKKLIKQIAEGVNVYMSEISPIKKLEPVKSLPPVMNESEKKLRKYIRTRLEENAGLRKASLNENKKSTTLKKLDEIIDKQFKLFESVVLKKKDKLNEVLGLEKIGINLTTEEQVAAAFKKLNPNNQEEINRLFQIAFKNILINPHMSGIGVKAKIATPQEKYNLLGQYVKGGGGSLRLDKTGKLIYVSKEFQDKGTINKTVGGGTRTQNSNFGE
jgi:hypothetical protein